MNMFIAYLCLIIAAVDGARIPVEDRYKAISYRRLATIPTAGKVAIYVPHLVSTWMPTSPKDCAQACFNGEQINFCACYKDGVLEMAPTNLDRLVLEAECSETNLHESCPDFGRGVVSVTDAVFPWMNVVSFKEPKFVTDVTFDTIAAETYAWFAVILIAIFAPNGASFGLIAAVCVACSMYGMPFMVLGIVGVGLSVFSAEVQFEFKGAMLCATAGLIAARCAATVQSFPLIIISAALFAFAILTALCGALGRSTVALRRIMCAVIAWFIAATAEEIIAAPCAINNLVAQVVDLVVQPMQMTPFIGIAYVFRVFHVLQELQVAFSFAPTAAQARNLVSFGYLLAAAAYTGVVYCCSRIGGRGSQSKDFLSATGCGLYNIYPSVSLSCRRVLEGRGSTEDVVHLVSAIFLSMSAPEIFILSAIGYSLIDNNFYQLEPLSHGTSFNLIKELAANSITFMDGDGARLGGGLITNGMASSVAHIISSAKSYVIDGGDPQPVPVDGLRRGPGSDPWVTFPVGIDGGDLPLATSSFLDEVVKAISYSSLRGSIYVEHSFDVGVKGGVPIITLQSDHYFGNSGDNLIGFNSLGEARAIGVIASGDGQIGRSTTTGKLFVAPSAPFRVRNGQKTPVMPFTALVTAGVKGASGNVTAAIENARGVVKLFTGLGKTSIRDEFKPDKMRTALMSHFSPANGATPRSVEIALLDDTARAFVKELMDDRKGKFVNGLLKIAIPEGAKKKINLIIHEVLASLPDFNKGFPKRSVITASVKKAITANTV